MEQTPGNKQKKHICAALVAHVDSGKTTLSEGMLYLSGSIRKLGRVDHKDTFLDDSDIERERGITVFSKQADIVIGDKTFTMLDTPGHVDFSAEMERTLQVLDYAILVISGSDGIQSHVLTLWRLLKIYAVPTFIFVNKMDQDGCNSTDLMKKIKDGLGDECVSFMETGSGNFYDELAMCDEQALDEYLLENRICDDMICTMIAERKVFPCFFGSALKLTGVEYFMEKLCEYTVAPVRGKEFGARVFKISRDERGNRLTHMKITGGTLVPKMMLNNEKINEIRYYAGGNYVSINEAVAGVICAVTGLSETFAGQGLGNLKDITMPVLEPVMVYGLNIPSEVNVNTFFPKLRLLEEENPELHIVWNESRGEINVKLMGEIQTEVLKRMIRERFDVDVSFNTGSIVYKETVADAVEGIGHYEPLRHYAEVHVIIEPAERGSGVHIKSECSEEVLAKNWQRLIMTHLSEKVHSGVLTGSELTDVNIVLVSGRAHLKHTEGGDFREATYRAVRQGLMNAKNVLLEPVYSFRLGIPSEYTGRAMTDIRKMHGTSEPPEMHEDRVILTGSVPVSEMRDYQLEVAAYSKGLGKLTYSLKGYEECHNAEDVIEEIGYDAIGDIANPPGSVFCSHGAGFYVGPFEVEEYMHLPKVLKKNNGENECEKEEADAYRIKRQHATGSESENYQAVSMYGLADKELEDIFVRTYGQITHRKETSPKKIVDFNSEPDPRSHEAKRRKKEEQRENYLLVDGYNIINAWPELKILAGENLESARNRLLDIMCNYQGFRKMTLIVVFDAYRVPGKKRDVSEYNNIYVVYTQEAETADQYIEKTVHKIGKNNNVTVATSDALEQVIIFGDGAVRLSASGLLDEVKNAESEIKNLIKGD